jgi:cytoskeletal protein CcmA (bactofilin family)
MATKTDIQGAINIIAAGTTIEGDIVSDGDVRIDGVLKGTINTKGKLVVGPTGMVEGDVTCKSADISGKVNASFNVSEILSLKASSHLNGDIVVNKLAIEPGASFTGRCSMGSVIKEIQNDKKIFGGKTA